MKKMIVFFLLSICFNAFSQNYSIINFIGNTDRDVLYEIYLNKHFIGSINGYENLEYKMYSEGAVTVVTRAGNAKYTASIEVKNNAVLYFLCKSAKAGNLIIDEETGKELIKLRGIKKAEENIIAPIAIISTSTSTSALVPSSVNTSQAVVNKDYSIINFIGNGDADISYSIYLNDRLIGSINGDENLEYKLYSEGRLTIMLITRQERIIKSVDVKRGETVYFLCFTSKVIDEKLAMQKMYNITKRLKLEESKSDPILKLPESESNGPKQGTCFLLNKNGYLLTNYHVISGSKMIQIKGIGNYFSTLYGVDVVAYDVFLDLALLKLKNSNVSFPDIPYSLNLNTFQQGTKAFVMGYPMSNSMGEEIKLTDGIISAKSGYKGTISHYQFSAPVQPGNSGSPLFNENGDLIAIINSKITEAEGVGYAIKAQYIDAFIKLTGTVPFENTATDLSKLSLSDKALKLKNFVFIVKSE